MEPNIFLFKTFTTLKRWRKVSWGNRHVLEPKVQTHVSVKCEAVLLDHTDSKLWTSYTSRSNQKTKHCLYTVINYFSLVLSSSPFVRSMTKWDGYLWCKLTVLAKCNKQKSYCMIRLYISTGRRIPSSCLHGTLRRFRWRRADPQPTALKGCRGHSIKIKYWWIFHTTPSSPSFNLYFSGWRVLRCAMLGKALHQVSHLCYHH